jgi:hypothetical protein
MPIASLAVGGATSILGGLFGGIGAQKAASNYNRVAQAAGQAMYGATNTATTGVNNANTTGQQQINTGVTNANSTLSGQYNSLNNNLYTPLNGMMSGIYTGLNQNLNPYLAAGQMGTSQMMAAMAPGGSLTQQFNFDPNNVTQNPAYQFNLQQGEQAIQRQAAATGSSLGAGTQKQLAQYATGLASNTEANLYNQALTTFQSNRANTMQNLSTLMGAGQFGVNAANQLGTTQAGQALQSATSQGGLQNQVVLPMAGYSYGGGTAGAQLGLSAAMGAGQLGIQGTNDANQFYMGGAQAQAAGTAAGYQSLGNMFNNLGGAGMSYMMNGGGGSSLTPFDPSSIYGYYGPSFSSIGGGPPVVPVGGGYDTSGLSNWMNANVPMAPPSYG